jgi:hypothetical protein
MMKSTVGDVAQNNQPVRMAQRAGEIGYLVKDRIMDVCVFSVSPCAFVMPGRSKERSDAAQTLGSIPLRQPKNAADQNKSAP